MSRSSGATISTVPFLLASRAMRATCAYGDSCGSNALKDESAWLLNRDGFYSLGIKALSKAVTRGGIALRITSQGLVAQREAH